ARRRRRARQRVFGRRLQSGGGGHLARGRRRHPGRALSPRRRALARGRRAREAAPARQARRRRSAGRRPASWERDEPPPCRRAAGRTSLRWISLPDAVAGLRRALFDPAIEGPVNLVAPGAVTNAELTRALGRALHRPTLVPVPRFALRGLLGGDMAEEMLLT